MDLYKVRGTRGNIFNEIFRLHLLIFFFISIFMNIIIIYDYSFHNKIALIIVYPPITSFFPSI